MFISRRTRHGTPRDVIAAYALLGVGVKSELCDSAGCQHMYYIGKHGTAEGELNRPAGIAFDDPYLYVCDCKNNRVNVYTGFCNTRTISHRNMFYPLDVKLHCKAIFVLNSKPPFVLEFDSTGILRSVFLCNFILCDFIPCFFCYRLCRSLLDHRQEAALCLCGKERYIHGTSSGNSSRVGTWRGQTGRT